jgi:hypothetical protein
MVRRALALILRRYKNIRLLDRFKRVNKMVKSANDIPADWGEDNPGSRGRWPRKLLLMTLIVIAGYFAWRQFGPRLFDPANDMSSRDSRSDAPSLPSQAEQDATRALAEGRYDQARDAIRRNELSKLYANLYEELDVPFNFNYDLNDPVASRDGRLQLPEATRYWAHLRVGPRCYLYLLQRNTAGRWRFLFPNEQFADGANPVAAADIDIPKTGRFLNETGPGTETLYQLSSRWRQERLEKLAQEAIRFPGHEQPLLDYMAESLRAKREYPGLVCKKFEFDHQ